MRYWRGRLLHGRDFLFVLSVHCLGLSPPRTGLIAKRVWLPGL